ncbi:MAG TPA: response regulator [Chitinispirillaceae bacterium]|nr:response regulator [Chitinispirillaceae bacterium]
MIQGSSLFWRLFNNLAIFTVLIVVYSYLHGVFSSSHRTFFRQIVMGLIFGAAVLICMQVKITVHQGVLVDQRNTVVILGGAFGGPITGLITAIIAVIYRIHLGGEGVYGGCIGITLSVIAGCIGFYNRKKINTISKATLAALAATIFILPGFIFIIDIQTGFKILQKMTIPYGSAIFLGVFICGLVMFNEEYRHEIKNKLRASEKQYRELFESLIDVCFRTDPNGKIIIISPSCEKIFGYSPAELVGKRFSDYFNDSDIEGTFLSKVSCAGNIDNFQTIFTKKDGSSVWISVNARAYFDKNGAFAGFEAMVRDITQIRKAMEEKIQLQENIKQIQKMESIGTLAGGIAHDFNNTLAGIIGGAELLRDNDITDQQHRQYVNLILTSADKASDLTRKLLTFSRKGTPIARPLDIIPILSDTVAILRRTIDKSITIHEDYRIKSAFLEGDGALLQNVFLNLGINAGHAMAEGGQLIFSVETVELSKKYCDLSTFEISPGAFVEITVSDTGHGIPKDIITRIFEPFFTTKEQGKGTGLGLSAVYGTVQDHHGAISVYSEVGKGTVFHVYLPVTNKKVDEFYLEPLLPKGSGIILLVDDEELVQATASTILSKLGYEVISAENGKKGIELYQKHQKEIRLVILDMIMPVMGGREAFKTLHALNPSLPIIISSGFSREEDLEALRQIGVSGFLRKPFHRVELAEMISKLLA